MVVPVRLFSWDYRLNWANELFWVKNSPAKEKVYFYAGQFPDCVTAGACQQGRAEVPLVPQRSACVSVCANYK